MSFGGVPSILSVPLNAVTGFADPHVQFGLRFRPPEEHPANDADEPVTTVLDSAPQAPPAPDADETDAPDSTNQVVSLDAFRKRPPSKD
ncbi:MAG: hypothetical protein EON55_25900 [Alphaproteobacteria bacterium]|nr:MAG: hypothetical protein EON55_25900 [Alphaproteobacteria bacterium]